MPEPASTLYFSAWKLRGFPKIVAHAAVLFGRREECIKIYAPQDPSHCFELCYICATFKHLSVTKRKYQDIFEETRFSHCSSHPMHECIHSAGKERQKLQMRSCQSESKSSSESCSWCLILTYSSEPVLNAINILKSRGHNIIIKLMSGRIPGIRGLGRPRQTFQC